MIFITLLILATLGIAGSAAFFSIYGLANIFEGSFWPVVIMASSLEAGKLVAASFVYRYWSNITFLMKAYLLSAILVLMMITSAGIFGYLSAAYQQDALPLKEITSTMYLLKEEKVDLKSRIKQIDGIIAAIGPNYITKRIEQQEKFAPERRRIDTRLVELTKEIRELSRKKINQEVHTGPITFIAKAMGNEIDDATKWMIFLIIFAFDPLAVILTIGANMAIVLRQEELGIMHTKRKIHMMDDEEDEPIEGEPSPIVKDLPSLESMLSTLNGKQEHELTEEELAERNGLRQMIKRTQVTEKVRNPNA